MYAWKNFNSLQILTKEMIFLEITQAGDEKMSFFQHQERAKKL